MVLPGEECPAAGLLPQHQDTYSSIAQVLKLVGSKKNEFVILDTPGQVMDTSDWLTMLHTNL